MREDWVVVTTAKKPSRQDGVESVREELVPTAIGEASARQASPSRYGGVRGERYPNSVRGACQEVVRPASLAHTSLLLKVKQFRAVLSVPQQANGVRGGPCEGCSVGLDFPDSALKDEYLLPTHLTFFL